MLQLAYITVRAAARQAPLCLWYVLSSLPCHSEASANVTIAGNALPADFFPAVLPNLLYLEAAACSLTSLPTSFATSLPALRILNLNYNFLTSLDGLHGMRGLRKLTVVGCRLGGKEKGIVKSLKGLTGLEELDLRYVPRLNA